MDFAGEKKVGLGTQMLQRGGGQPYLVVHIVLMAWKIPPELFPLWDLWA